MIRLKAVTLSRGGENLLESADASIHDGECVALIGPNGSGKSSLLAALLGDVIVDSGELELPPGPIHALAQSIPHGAQAAWSYVFSAHEALAEIDARIRSGAESPDSLPISDQQRPGLPSAGQPSADHASPEQIAADQERWIELGGNSAYARICELLAGLGFTQAQMNAPVDSLSGGWRMRLNLARAMFVPSDLLLLDEPTNHLDLDAIIWLERWLLRYPGTAIVVSHDRDFLDRVADASISIEHKKLIRYKGGYSEAERLRAERQRLAQQQAAQRERRVEQLTRFIERFRAQATKARQVQSRIKAIERMAEIAQYAPDRVARFELASAEDAPDPLMVVDDLSAGYAERPVLEHVSLVLNKGARIGILGRNGAGKSTLVRTLVADLPKLAGDIQRAGSLKIGYFAQTAVEALRPDDTALSLLRREWPELTETELRTRLGSFDFAADAALRPISTFSGGEKARLVLATIVLRKPHLLVLDEPTNHLDGPTRDALGEALAEYDGALLLVSHDRYLLRATVDRFVLVDNGRLESFDGDLDDYIAWLFRGKDTTTGAAASPSAPGSPAPETLSRRDERRLQAERRKRLAELVRPIEREMAELERGMRAAETEIGVIDAELNNPLLYQNAASGRIVELGRTRARLHAQRDDAETRWLELAERKDRIEQDIAAESGG